MSSAFDAPGIDEHPDVSDRALQALVPGTLYFNVAGSGPTFPVAHAAAHAFRTWLNGVGMFSHVGYDAYNAALDAARRDVAAFVGDPGGADRIALAVSATDGLNALVAGLRIPAGSLIATTAEEHGSALLPLYRRRDRGDRLRVVRYVDDASFLGSIAAAFADGARALVVSLVSCKTGKVLPVRRAADLARRAGAVTIVDCAQALGQIAVDVHELGADAVVTLGYKWMHGPLGAAAFWVRDLALFDVERLGWRSQTSLDLVGGYALKPQAERFETGTVDAAAFVGLRQALAVHRELGPVVGDRIRALRAGLFARLREMPFDLLSRPEDPTGIVVVAPRGGDAAGIVARMWTDEGIVVKHLQEAEGIPDGIRISFWALHRPEHVDRLADALARQARVPA